MDERLKGSIAHGALVAVGLAIFGTVVGSSLIRFKSFERVVSVKGLSEREVPADVAVWPIRFAAANADLPALYAALEADSKTIVGFLVAAGFEEQEITVAAPTVTDKLAERYGNPERIELRYAAQQAITVYSKKVDVVRQAMNRLGELGKKGIAFGGAEYGRGTEFLFTKLNDIKPQMIEEATRKAREVAEKFAADSASKLGRIRSANQGQFSITDRDSNTPHIKNVRVVATVDYYLSD
jgi:hypothetical protein